MKQTVIDGRTFTVDRCGNCPFMAYAGDRYGYGCTYPEEIFEGASRLKTFNVGGFRDTGMDPTELSQYCPLREETLSTQNYSYTPLVPDREAMERARRHAEAFLLGEEILDASSDHFRKAYTEWLRHVCEIDPMDPKDPRALHQSKKAIGLRQATCSRSGSKNQDQKGTGPE